MGSGRGASGREGEGRGAEGGLGRERGGREKARGTNKPGRLTSGERRPRKKQRKGRMASKEKIKTDVRTDVEVNKTSRARSRAGRVRRERKIREVQTRKEKTFRRLKNSKFGGECELRACQWSLSL